MSSFDLKFVKPENTSFVKKVLPQTNFTGVISKLCRKSIERDDYELEILCKSSIPFEQAKQFVHDFGEKNECVYVCRNTGRSDCLYRASFKCQHSKKRVDLLNIKSRKKQSKGTACPSCIHISSKITKENIALTKINIKFRHNHELTSAEALRYHKPQPSVVEAFEKLYREGKKSPAEALKAYKQSVLSNIEASEAEKIMLNRKIMPDYDWVRHFYNTLQKRILSSENRIVSAVPDSTSSPSHQPENVVGSSNDERFHPVLEINIEEQPFEMEVEVVEIDEDSLHEDVVEQLSRNFARLIKRLEQDPEYYRDGVVEMNKNLKALLDDDSSSTDLLNALLSFNSDYTRNCVPQINVKTDIEEANSTKYCSKVINRRRKRNRTSTNS
ncbi:uncharacterized protein LOC135846360 [Planococcus citri]|uniref:uncharacterized protein LOC135846360 n=1 Tax=Planococcus citri TaxID=170843 RepID=UPI0031F85C2B